MKAVLRLAVPLLALAAGCRAYVWTSSVPEDLRKVAVPTFRNESDVTELGNVVARQVLREFYGPFAQTLEKAETEIEKIEIKDEVSDVVCDKCGAMMVYKLGRFGRFLACPNFPECRNTKGIQVELEAPCPTCGGKLLEKTSRKGRKFYGCEHYPECEFVSWEMPVAQKCGKCGSYMVLKRGRKGETYHVCANESCRDRVLVQSEEEE